MLDRKSRVILASEYPKVRHFLEKAVKEKPQAVIVGEAESANAALTLARKLRPDIAIIDSYLPHNFGIDTISLSRMGGLDTAETISAEMPNTRVVLVTNTDEVITPGIGQGLDLDAFFPEKKRKLLATGAAQQHHEVLSHAVSFARVGTKPDDSPLAEDTSLGDTAIFLGTLALFVGLALTATMFLAFIGAPLALLGMAALLFGIVANLLSSRSETAEPVVRKVRNKNGR